MKLQHKLAIAAGSMFALSYFLPAFEKLWGYECFGVCWGVLIKFPHDSVPSFGQGLYYSGFVATNALLVVLLGASFFASRHLKLRLWSSAILALHVLSWLVVNLVSMAHGEEIALRVGYFVWLLSYILLFCMHVVARRAASQPPGSASSSHVPAAGREPREGWVPASE